MHMLSNYIIDKKLRKYEEEKFLHEKVVKSKRNQRKWKIEKQFEKI